MCIDVKGGRAAMVSAPDAAGLVDKIRRIPDQHRVFAVSDQAADLEFGLARSVLDRLVSIGLPVRGVGPAARFDRFDLLNVGLYLGVGAPQRAVRRFWAMALNRTDPGVTRYEMRYVTRGCPQPGHGTACHYQLRFPSDEVIEERTVPAGYDGTLATVQLALPNHEVPLPAPVQDLLDETSGLQFMRLPEAVRRDVSFIRETGLCDCAGETELLCELGRQRGLSMRGAYGFIVVPPISSTHYWAEVQVDGEWVPVDPVLIRAMLTWGVLQPDRWNHHRSPAAVFSRVCDPGEPIVQHEGVRFGTLTWPTRKITNPD